MREEQARVSAAAGTLLEQPSPTPPLSDRPSIAVLPFTNMSGDSDQDYIADGIVEDITTELSRFRDLTDQRHEGLPPVSAGGRNDRVKGITMLRTAFDEKITPHIPVSDMGRRAHLPLGALPRHAAPRFPLPAPNGKLRNSRAPRTARLSHPRCIS